MASVPNTPLPRRPLANGLKNALDFYGHITPPSEHDDSDCTRFIGCCLVELNLEQQRYNERLQLIEKHTRGSPYSGPTFSSQNDKIEGIWEEIGELKSKVDNIEDKVQDIEDKVQDIEDKLTSIEEKSQEQFETLQAEIGDLETKVDSLETKFNKVMFEQDVWASRQRNSLASRLHQPVHLVGMSYMNADGKAVLKVPTWPVKSVGYYWKMHNRENHKKLIDAHLFYQLDFRHWALSDDEGSNDSYMTDDLDQPITTLKHAVSMYPDRAVMALFNELGLVYSRFQEQVEREQLRPPALQKRSLKDTSSQLERRVRRSSNGSTIDLVAVSASPTASASIG